MTLNTPRLSAIARLTIGMIIAIEYYSQDELLPQPAPVRLARLEGVEVRQLEWARRSLCY